jgi:hypothetical protein
VDLGLGVSPSVSRATRFVEVGTVVGVVPVDGTRAVAVIEDARGLDSVLVRIG